MAASSVCVVGFRPFTFPEASAVPESRGDLNAGLEGVSDEESASEDGSDKQSQDGSNEGPDSEDGPIQGRLEMK